MVLPFEYLKSTLFYLEYCIEHSQQIEKMVRCVLFLVKYHHEQLMSSREMAVKLRKMKDIMRRELTRFRNKIGYNVQAMQYMQDLINSKARYIRDKDNFKEAEVDEDDLYKFWAEEKEEPESEEKKKDDSDSGSGSDSDMIDID